MASATEPSAAEELAALLGESAASVGARVARTVERTAGRPLALYGAGQHGREVLARLRSVGVEPAAFADDTPAKHGQRVDGLLVDTPERVARRCPGVCFVVTILNPQLSFLAARRRLRARTGAAVASVPELVWRYGTARFPCGPIVAPSELLANAAELRALFAALADEESRRQLVAHLRFRLHLDYEGLPPSAGPTYLPDELVGHLPDDVVYVDCGAYDGDSLRDFLAHRQGRFGMVIAFEPDKVSHRRLVAWHASLEETLATRIRLMAAAVGAATEESSFRQTGTMSSALTPEGDQRVRVLRLADLVLPAGAHLFLKMDIEGAEWDALQGCGALLRQRPSTLAISVYHRPHDLWRIPLYLAALGHQLYLRTQGEDGMDLVSYALPSCERLR